MKSLKYVVKKILGRVGQKGRILSEFGYKDIRAVFITEKGDINQSFDSTGMVVNRRYKVVMPDIGFEPQYGDKLIISKKSYFIEKAERVLYLSKYLYVNLICILEDI